MSTDPLGLDLIDPPDRIDPDFALTQEPQFVWSFLHVDALLFGQVLPGCEEALARADLKAAQLIEDRSENAKYPLVAVCNHCYDVQSNSLILCMISSVSEHAGNYTKHLQKVPDAKRPPSVRPSSISIVKDLTSPSSAHSSVTAAHFDANVSLGRDAIVKRVQELTFSFVNNNNLPDRAVAHPDRPEFRALLSYVIKNAATLRNVTQSRLFMGKQKLTSTRANMYELLIGATAFYIDEVRNLYTEALKKPIRSLSWHMMVGQLGMTPQHGALNVGEILVGEKGTCAMHQVDLVMEHATGIVTRRQRNEVVDAFEACEVVRKKVHKTARWLIENKSKKRFAMYHDCCLEYGRHALKIPVPNSTRVAGTWLMYNGIVRARWNLKRFWYDSTSDPSLSNKTLIVVAELEAVLFLVARFSRLVQTEKQCLLSYSFLHIFITLISYIKSRKWWVARVGDEENKDNGNH
eukprot:IDg5324t1